MMRRWIAVGLALQVAGCASLSRSRPAVPDGPRDLGAASPEERAAYIRRAQVWQPVPTAALDLLAGPPGADAIAFGQDVACDYDPEPPRSGRTPKFHCLLAPGDSVKVKYGSENGEVYAEVAATRLFWALGFGADRNYPATVICRNCPPDPWRRPAPEPGASRTFDPATIERGTAGKKIEVRKADKGWEWWELLTVDERQGGAPRAHVDALRLLAAFLQHGDNKGEQQRLLCLPGGVGRDSAGHETCSRPFLAVADLGATFSRAGLLNTNKFDLHHWSSVPVWKDRPECVAKLKRSFTGSFGDPRISEAGRAFLAGLLDQLSVRQIRDLFVAARADRTGERIKGADGRERPVTVDDWVQAFLQRRAEIVEHRCPE